MTKKVIILQHNGGRLANQLWPFVSIYAYCLENNFELDNYCFFEYTRYFSIKIQNRLIDWVFFKRTGNLNDSFLNNEIGRLQVVFAYEVILHIIPLESQTVYGNSLTKDVTIEDKDNLRPLEMNSKSEIHSWDFLEEIEDEELKIEEWMIDPKFWQKIIQDHN